MTLPLTTIARGADSGIVTPRRTIARDAASWRALWAAHAGPTSTAPSVDFSSRMVAAAFAGERPDPGHTIEIVTADSGPGTVTIAVRELPPPHGMAAAQVLVSPFHIVTLPRVEGEVRFSDGPTAAVDPPAAAHDSHPPHRRAGAVAAGESASSTGLEPNLAAALAYLAGPFSGLLILLVEHRNRYVRFHAWQAVLGLGGVGVLAVTALLFSFFTLLLSPLAFTTMYRLAEILAVVWVLVWVWCLVKAFTGREWKMPVAGHYAERLATAPLPAVR
jgi:uncharacterized membrane protein